MELLTVKETSDAWGVSERMIRRLCSEGRVPNAILDNNAWLIPAGTMKPGRKPRSKNNKPKVKVPTVPMPPLAKRVLQQRIKNTHYDIYEYIQVNLTYSSNRMGSNRLTRNEVEQVYRTNKITTTFEPVKVDDIIETINHFSAIRYVIEHIPDKLTQTLIKKIHFILTYGTYADRKEKISSGSYRTRKSKMGIRASQIETTVADLLKEYENEAATMECILDFHVRFEKIHPFEDYNGRVGRLIMLKECLRHGVVPFIIDDKHRGAYNRGIASWSEDHDILLSVSLDAQKRFRGKLEVCNILQNSRSGSDSEE